MFAFYHFWFLSVIEESLFLILINQYDDQLLPLFAHFPRLSSLIKSFSSLSREKNHIWIIWRRFPPNFLLLVLWTFLFIFSSPHSSHPFFLTGSGAVRVNHVNLRKNEILILLIVTICFLLWNLPLLSLPEFNNFGILLNTSLDQMIARVFLYLLNINILFRDNSVEWKVRGKICTKSRMLDIPGQRVTLWE